MSRYFSRFPLVDYNGVPAKNILARVDFTQETKNDIYSNFDYVLQDHAHRPDYLSSKYYGSSAYDWLIYMSNNVVDPYYDCYMDPEQFNQFIVSKYGNTEIARNTVIFYRNDWSADESLINESVYDGLSPEIKKYWKPKVNITNQIIGYERIKEDWTVSTNKVIELVLNVDVTEFNIGDRVTQPSTSSHGTVVTVNPEKSSVVLQHIFGEFTVNESDGVVSVTTLYVNIPDAESVFWAPVSAYSYEEEKNELKRYINLIKSSYVSDIEKSFAKLINP